MTRRGGAGPSAAPAIATPCTGVCAIEADDMCRGCGRTLDEIAGWGLMTPAARDAIMAALPARRRLPVGD
ncbi:DUF1289 domain-containing protein [Sphingomonas sp. A2-49]|uniref:DUF1289 domain-containing protein n=1 Tax=Sphingomonas sp. A2-49 TaxID=1391375 RepID=UPI0021D390BA|nr:DUF1289 domain-containing protein [Sphingomonas sp. A2-49]MCU6455741.1 DUF1289 domain-containing protein [Sphingomonas sp. A2-49]